MKKVILLLALILLLVAWPIDARVPKVGDQVGIMSSAGMSAVVFDGTITEISDGLICLNCSLARTGSETLWGSEIVSMPELNREICIGVGQITMLQWTVHRPLSEIANS